MWDNMMGWSGLHGGAMFGLMHLAWWVLVILCVAVLVRWSTRTSRRRDDAGADRALELLRERFARGEIDKAEFEARKLDLS